MKKIILFSDLENLALDFNIRKDLVLFGDKDMIQQGENNYDIIFHHTFQPVDFSKDYGTDLVIPVFKNKGNQFGTIANAHHQTFQNIQRYARAEENPEGKYKLSFFDFTDNGISAQYSEGEPYALVYEWAMEQHPDTKETTKKIKEKRRKIDKLLY